MNFTLRNVAAKQVTDVSLVLKDSDTDSAALFIDIEKTYDSVWRDGLMMKLKEMGITGKIWTWIKDFLTGRTATINMNGFKGKKFSSYLGLPQGSVIAALLFILFIADWYLKVKSEKVKFADDGTIWITGKDWHELVENLRRNFKEIMAWAKKWRLKLSMVQTEFCMFSLNNQVLEQAKEFTLVIDGQTITYNPTPKILGITLDEKLRFEKHIENVERKAIRSLDSLRKVKETEIISPNCMLQLYKALVIQQLEYAAPGWQIGNCSPLEKIQRKGLALCLGVPGTAGLDALEVEAGVKPLELRREELAIRQAAKIMSKENDTCINKAWNTYVESELMEHKISPFGKMSIQIADMISNTGISLHCLEKEFNFSETLQPSKRQPEYWQNLGSSKSRTKNQEAQSREIIEKIIEGCDENTVIAFTDGSCLGNPGPCGAGACIYMPGYTDPTIHKQPVTSCGSILLGELIAIKMVINEIQNQAEKRELNNVKKVHIFSDSQCAIGHLSLGWEAKMHRASIQEVKSDIQRLETSGIQVELSWSPGHSNIKGNEYADQMAKETAEEAKEKMELPPIVTMGDVKTAARESGKMKWQDMWEKSEKGRHLFNFRNQVGLSQYHKFESTKGEITVIQLRTGYARLNEYLHKINIVDSNKCQCGQIESISHYLLECSLYENERENLRRKLFQTCGIIHLD